MGVYNFINRLVNRFIKNYSPVGPDGDINSNGGSSAFVDGLTNWWKGFTGSGLTQRDKDLNEMNMQNVEDTAAAQIAGYQKAGVNPALMYGSGASNSAPQAASSGAVGNMSELMQLLALPSQIALMGAQTKQTNAQAVKTATETGQIKQIMDFYPKLTESTIGELVSRTGLNIANVSKSEAETANLAIDKIIKQAEANEASAFFKARREYEEAKDDESRASAAASAARAAWDIYEKEYTESHNGARPSSSSILALANAITGWLGINPDSPSAQRIVQVVADDVKNPQQFYKKGFEQGKAIVKKGVEKGKSLFNSAKNAFNRQYGSGGR